MKTLITAAAVATLLAMNADPATAGEDVPAFQLLTEQTAIPAAVQTPMRPNRGLDLRSTAMLIQPADPSYDQ